MTIYRGYEVKPVCDEPDYIDGSIWMWKDDGGICHYSPTEDRAYETIDAYKRNIRGAAQ